MRTARYSRPRRAWRRLAVGVGLAALIVGLSAAPSTAQHADTTTQTASTTAAPRPFSVPAMRFPSSGRYSPPHTGSGDREYSGHGPSVVAQARLTGIGTARLSVMLCLNAKETVFDFTTANGCSTEYFVRSAPPGECFDSTNLFWFDELRYTDTDHAVDEFPGQLEGSFVKSFGIVGDTSGNDAGTDTGMWVFTHPFTGTTVPCI